MRQMRSVLRPLVIVLALAVALAYALTPTEAQISTGTINAKQSGAWSVTAVQGAAGASPWVVTQGGNSAFLAGQQAVTASAVALATNTAKGVCVKALVANTINVYVGPTGVAITTGDELAPGDGRCYPLDNTNRVFVIASTTGASVSWSAWN